MAVPTVRKGRIALWRRARDEIRGRRVLLRCRKSRQLLRFKRLILLGFRALPKTPLKLDSR